MWKRIPYYISHTGKEQMTMGENKKFFIIEVYESDGTRTLMTVSNYESLSDGYTYFYTSYGTNRCVTSHISQIVYRGIKYDPISEAIGYLAGATTVWMIKTPVKKVLKDSCPSNNPIIKVCWKGAIDAGCIGLGLAVKNWVTKETQEWVQPAVDLFKVGVNFGEEFVKNFKEKKNEDFSGMKEVFEENV